MTHLIEVTEADIRKGIRNDPFSCPVALACKRYFKIDDPHELGITNRLRIGLCNEHIGSLPSKTILFIDKFDDDEPVEPFSFIVEIDYEPRS